MGLPMKKSIRRLSALAFASLMASGCVGTLKDPIKGTFDGKDPVADTQFGSNPRGDLDLWGVRYTKTNVQLWAKHQVLFNPVEDPFWRGEDLLTGLEWVVESSNDTNVDFIVDAYVDSDATRHVRVTNAHGNTTCTGTFGVNGALELAIDLDPTTCFGGIGPLRFGVSSWYETDNELTYDEAPDAPAFTGWIVPAPAA